MYPVIIYGLYLLALLGSFITPFYAPSLEIRIVLLGAALFYWSGTFLKFAGSSSILKAYEGNTQAPEFVNWMHKYLRNSMLHALGFISVCATMVPIWPGAGLTIVLLLPIMGLYFLIYEGLSTKTA